MRLVVSDADIREAAARLHGVAVPTTLVPFPGLSPSGYGTLLIKPESLQPAGSFKLRGAYNAISARLAADRARGVVAHSSGNHGRPWPTRPGCSASAAIVVPDNAPPVKTAATRACGAELVTVAPTLSRAPQRRQELVDRHGYTLIPPFDHPEVIAGQGTIGLEIMASQPDTDLFLVPVSGGGLISGIATAARSVNPDVTVSAWSPNWPPTPGTRWPRGSGWPGPPAQSSAPWPTRCGSSRSASCRSR